ncbi:phospholipase A and acyltransferase 3-like isoform X2 [Acanthopagrus latus]|uniref:phospholipase A and acyltransferase 3-like isoform X2 n=1 Tax=Acanthopagrus latus TaxID=8177 RepID=UPI00187C22F0|nr:phospholipase A and acyltransferase 3-like isoform X2 [Acanthopagrus latus]
MGQSQSDPTPKPGDLIEITRVAYQHWAVYVGDGYIVHVTLPPGGEVSGAAPSSSRSGSAKKAMVRKQKLQEVVQHHKWKINNILDKKYKPRPPSVIVEEALGQVINAEVAAGFAPLYAPAALVLWFPVSIVAAAVLISRR